MSMRPHSRALILCSVLATSVASGGSLYAQPSADPNQRATELYKKGNDYYDKAKWADAETMYRAAFELRKSFEIAGNLGDVEMIQGKARDAAEHLAFALTQFPPSGKPAQKEALQKRLREATIMIGTIHVKVNEPGAEVILDGKPLGKSPIESDVYVDRGDHVMEAKLEGYEPVTEKLTATAGSTHDVNLTLKRKEAPKSTLPPPGAGGAGAGEAPSGSSKPNTVIVIGGAMVSVAALATGIGLSVAANGKADDAVAIRDQLRVRGAPLCNTSGLDAATAMSCADLRSTLEDKDSFTNTAIAAFVIGGVAATATAVYTFWPLRKTSKAAEVRPVPVMTGKEGGLWLMGRF